ncbi:MAG: PD-(D/E)XK nuclease-like domain-containing protein [Oscillospiraceae bacterium]
MKLTNANYYSAKANREYMSVSQFKDFNKCEAMAMAKLNGLFVQEKSTALLVGSYVDSYFEGTLGEFKEANPEIFKKDGDLKADYKQAETIIKRIESDKLFMEYMAGEKQIIRTGELFGAKWKIKIDSLPKDKIVDLKCMRSMERIMGISFVEHWQYDWQMAVYREIERYGREKKLKKCVSPLETYLAVATKETPTNLEVIHIPDWRLRECLLEIENLMPRVLAVKNGEVEPERCGVCEYCRMTKVLTAPIEFEDVGFSNKDLKAMKGLI